MEKKKTKKSTQKKMTMAEIKKANEELYKKMTPQQRKDLARTCR